MEGDEEAVGHHPAPALDADQGELLARLAAEEDGQCKLVLWPHHLPHHCRRLSKYEMAFKLSGHELSRKNRSLQSHNGNISNCNTMCIYDDNNLHMIEDISKTSQASCQCALSCIASNKLIEQKSYHSFSPSLRSMEDRGMP